MFVSGTINTSRSMLLVKSLLCIFLLNIYYHFKYVAQFPAKADFPFKASKDENTNITLQISSNHLDYYLNPEFEICPRIILLLFNIFQHVS